MAKEVKGRWKKPMGKLHVLLANSFPTKRTAAYSVLNIEWLAEKLGMSEEGVYKWLREDRIPFKRAKQIAKMRECTAEFEDFLPFIG